MRIKAALVACALMACAFAGLALRPSLATYIDQPYGHFAVREIVIVDHTGDAQMATGAQHAADLWNATGANFHLTVQPGIVSTDNAVCYDASTSGRIHLCLDPFAFSRGGYTDFIEFEPGYTQVGPNTHFRANAVHMCGQVGPNCYDWATLPEGVNRVLPHEVGHALGLPHQASPSRGDTCSIMATTGCYSEVPSAEDVNTLRALYSHVDSEPTPTTTTVVPTSSSTIPATTTTKAGDPLCTTLATMYVSYAGNPSAQAAVRQQQAARGCSVT